MRRRLALALTAAALLLPAAAQAMSVDQFLARAEALKARGVMALFSSDIGVLKREMADAITAWQAESRTRRAAGQAPRACIPPGERRMNSTELLASFRALPPATRRGSVRDGLAQVLVAKYPCGGAS